MLSRSSFMITALGLICALMISSCSDKTRISVGKTLGEKPLVISALLFVTFVDIFRNVGEKTLGEKNVNEFWHVSSSEQRKELKMLTTQEDIDQFRVDFWKALDPTPETPVNELRDVYYERYHYANKHFSEGFMSGSRTDRGRIYILYGTPYEITIDPWIKQYGSGNTPLIESLEIWTYNMPTGRKKATSPYFEFDFSLVTFVFADMQGIGLYTQVYSTEYGEVDDSRFIGGTRPRLERERIPSRSSDKP